MIRALMVPALCLTAMAFGTANTALAASTDNNYTGFFGTTLDFSTEGTVVYTEEGEEGIEVFEGTYTWDEFFIFQIITLELLDGSDDGIFTGTGIGINGAILAIGYVNEDFSSPWGDIYLRSTAGTRGRHKTPALTPGAKGGR